MPRITPSLWFDSDGEGGMRPAGTVMAVDFVLDGQPYTAINGGPAYTFSEAISFRISCPDQDEVDHYWTRLGEGGSESQCGWLKDRYGVSWQVVPSALGALLGDPDPDRARRATQAMLQMKKLDVAALRAAAGAA